MVYPQSWAEVHGGPQPTPRIIHFQIATASEMPTASARHVVPSPQEVLSIHLSIPRVSGGRYTVPSLTPERKFLKICLVLW